MSAGSLTVAEPLLLAGDPAHVALASADRSMTYAELTTAVRAEAFRFGADRRVVLVEMRNDIPSVVRLLGALTARCPIVLLAADEGGRHDEIARLYAGAAELHPDLALLMSTSGSTGSPKLVRLSYDNLVANARSIAEYLGLTPDDRAITSLPLHYCYGLSVLTSHLAAGASVALTDLSVADERFWDLALAARATSFAGVPYTFDLLDSSGFAERRLPVLRYVTQAGGRMDPAQVQRFAALGEERGFDLVVMYGQTEATARMAYLPPHLASTRPGAIGIPVPGGHFRLAPLEDDAEPGGDGLGELVYTGPNVMMGYAQSPADLAGGPELTELRTGDLARQADDGLWEVHGRLDRHAKVFGLRLDLARLEAGLDDRVALVVVGEALHAFVDRPGTSARVHAELVAATDLPRGAVHVHRVEALPTTARGKTDFAALRRHAESAVAFAAEATAEGEAVGAATSEGLRDLYAVVLGRPDATVHDSFVDLGGDSLSFVEVSVQLATRLGHLPSGWQHLGPARLAATARPRLPGRRHRTPVEMSVLLRAAAITLIVVAHTDLWVVMGGAHVLLALAGFSLARFTLPVAGRVARSRRLLATTASVAVPAALWIAVAGQISGDYDLTTAFYLNQLTGPYTWSSDWHFWFLEVLVWCYLAVAVLLRIPLVDRWQRRTPFGCAVAVVVGTLALRYAVTGVGAGGPAEYTIPVAFWCLALGWAAGEARTPTQRWVVAALTLVGVAGFFPGDLQRQAVLLVGTLLLLVPWAVPVPRAVALAAQHLAHASLWIYLTHWQVYPGLEAAGLPVLAVLASLAVGLAAYRLQAALRGWTPHRASRELDVREVEAIHLTTRTRRCAPAGRRPRPRWTRSARTPTAAASPRWQP